MNKDTFNMLSRLQGYVSSDDAFSLRRIAMTLHRWHELECGDGNGYVERDENTDKTYWVNANTGKRWPTPDREKGALRRLAAIMSRYPELGSYVQGDPRGASLYIYRLEDLRAGRNIDCCYSSIGCAVYK